MNGGVTVGADACGIRILRMSRLCAGLMGALAVLAACASRSPAPAAAPPVPDPRDSDPSFDWQALVIAPLGSPLKSVPLAVHEALLFRDEAGGAGSPDEGECYAPDSPAPRFLGQTPDEYLLCFKQDRLTRIRAAVHVGAAQAHGIFDMACARWQRNAATAEAADPSGAGNARGGECAGRRGAVRYSARIGAESGESGPPEPATDAQADTVFIVLDGVPDT